MRSGTPASFATSATAAMSSTSSRGLPMASPNSMRVRGVTASRQAPVVGRVDEGRLDAEAGERHGELVVAPAVEVGRRHDVVAGIEQRHEGHRLGGQLAGGGQRADAALEAGHALLEHRRGRVHDPRVDVPEAVEVEEVGRVVGVLEDVGRGLIERHGTRAGDRVDALAGVQRPGVEAEVARLGHGRKRSIRREPMTPVDRADHVEAAEVPAVLHLDAQRSSTTPRAPRPVRARRPWATSPSCIQITSAPSSMASSTIGGCPRPGGRCRRRSRSAPAAGSSSEATQALPITSSQAGFTGVIQPLAAMRLWRGGSAGRGAASAPRPPGGGGAGG